MVTVTSDAFKQSNRGTYIISYNLNTQ